MLVRSLVRRSNLLGRRRWEQRIASVLTEAKEEEVDTATRRFNKIYRERQFTPVEEAFPLLDKERWSGLDLAAEEDGDGTTTGGAAGEDPNLYPSLQSSGSSAPPLERQRVLRATILGPQNAGKTSLVNALALSHVGVVSTRHGSTKDWTKAVATVHDTQLLLLDTPGLVLPRGEKDRRQHASGSARAWDSIFVADLVVLALPAGLGFVEPEHKKLAREVVSRAGARDLPVVFAVTMMDRVQTPKHRELYFSMRADFESMGLPVSVTHETSVKDGKGLVELKDALSMYARLGPWEHARRESTDLTPVDRVAEFLRQVYFELLPHEIPHTMRQRIIGWTQKDSGTTEVVVEVFFDRPSYMFSFYGKLEAICVRAQSLTEREMKSRYRFVFQAFTSPGGMSHR